MTLRDLGTEIGNFFGRYADDAYFLAAAILRDAERRRLAPVDRSATARSSLPRENRAVIVSPIARVGARNQHERCLGLNFMLDFLLDSV
jgi:hypothetical protein